MKELTIPAKTGNLPMATGFVTKTLEEMGCPAKPMFQIEVSVDELFTNIASYAYPDGDGTATIRIDDSGKGAVTITFLDAGVPFDPLEHEDPDITLLVEDRPIGGLGIFMVRKTMDSVTYERRDGMNVVTISKHWE